MSLFVTAPSKLALPDCIGGITMRFLRVYPLTFKVSISLGKYGTVAVNGKEKGYNNISKLCFEIERMSEHF